MKLPDIVRWRDVSVGNVQKVSPDITIRNSVPFSMNLLFDQVIGEAVSREGTNRLGSQFSASTVCTGLFQHLDSTHANSVLFAKFGTDIYDVVGDTSVLSSLTDTSKARFVTFLNHTLMVNGTENRSFSNTGGWVSSGGAFNLASIPTGMQYPTEFKDRVYGAVTDRLYFTNVPTSGQVSWGASGSGSIEIEQEDGGGTITALNKVPGYLMIYKQRSLKRWNFDSTFPDDLVNIGTQSHESVLRARGKNYFFYGPNGFYETDGGFPKKISRPVQRIIDAIPASFYSEINGWSDNENLYWSVGDLTIDFDRGYTETHNNVVLRYTIDTQSWAPLKYAHEFRFMHQYVDSTGAILLTGGDTDGQVLQLNVGNSDFNNQAITYLLQSPEFDFGFRERDKTVAEKIMVHSDVTIGAELQSRIDYKEWESIGTLQDIVTEVRITPLNGKVFEFRVVDSITGEQVKLRGLDFPNVDIHITTK